MVQVVFMARLRIREQSSFYSLFSISKFIVGTGLNIYFVAVLERGVAGLVMASLITAGLFSLISLVIMIGHLRFAFSFPAFRRMLRFGAPLVPGGIASLVMTSADRYFLQHYSTTAEVGLYSLGYKIGLVMNLIVQAVQLAWPAQMFEIMKEPGAERKFSRILTIYVLGLGYVSLGFSILSREMLFVMTTPDYYSASSVVPLILISYLFYGVRYMTNMGLSRENKLKYASMAIMGTAVINLGLNYWLIPRSGILGAAWATLISYGVLLIANMLINLHFWKIPYEYLRMVKVGIIWVLIYIVSLQISTANIIWNIVFKLLLLVCFPILLFLIGFFKKDELSIIKQIVFSRTKQISKLWDID
jgi:O-antigen/teichoic acid export membrane protein